MFRSVLNLNRIQFFRTHKTNHTLERRPKKCTTVVHLHSYGRKFEDFSLLFRPIIALFCSKKLRRMSAANVGKRVRQIDF